MAQYQVVCVNHVESADRSHRHIATLGLGDSSGWHQRISVAQALTQLRSPVGDRYYTLSTSTNRRAQVIEGACEVCGQTPYVRTTADGIKDNNLSRLSSCQVA
jgi:Protein of unknown function (DUF3892)